MIMPQVRNLFQHHTAVLGKCTDVHVVVRLLLFLNMNFIILQSATSQFVGFDMARFYQENLESTRNRSNQNHLWVVFSWAQCCTLFICIYNILQILTFYFEGLISYNLNSHLAKMMLKIISNFSQRTYILCAGTQYRTIIPINYT